MVCKKEEDAYSGGGVASFRDGLGANIPPTVTPITFMSLSKCLSLDTDDGKKGKHKSGGELHYGGLGNNVLRAKEMCTRCKRV